MSCFAYLHTSIAYLLSFPFSTLTQIWPFQISLWSPATCDHVENSSCVQVNDYNLKQPVDSGLEGDGTQMKSPNTHFVKPVRTYKHKHLHCCSSSSVTFQHANRFLQQQMHTACSLCLFFLMRVKQQPKINHNQHIQTVVKCRRKDLKPPES